MRLLYFLCIVFLTVQLVNSFIDRGFNLTVLAYMFLYHDL